MVKSIVIDEQANLALKSILASEQTVKSKTGLLIGTIEKSKDFILHVVSTPPVDESVISAATASNESKSTNELLDLNSEWILDHASQIHDMLVGGLDILGIYCVDLAPSIGRQILYKLFKTLNTFDYYKQMKFNTQRLIFLVDKTNKNINIKALDIATEQQSTKPTYLECDLLQQKNLLSSQFLKFNCNFDLNSTFRTPNVKSYNLLKEDFYNALSTEEMFDENRFVCLVSNYLVEDKTPLKELQASLDKLKEATSAASEYSTHGWTNKEYNAILMQNLSKSKREETGNDDANKRSSLAQSNPSSEGAHKNLDSLYELTGVCNLVVLMHNSMNTEQLKKLLIYDLMRSLYARVRLLVEDLDARKDIIGDVQLEDPYSNDVSAIEESYQTPNRIHIYFDDPADHSNKLCSFILTDYVFPDETDSDISERIRELFNYEIKEPSRQICFVEDLPPEIKASQSQEALKMSDASGSETQSVTNVNCGGSSISKQKLANGGKSSCNLNTSQSTISNYKYYLSAFIVGSVSLFGFYYSFVAAKFLNDENDDIY